MRFRRPVLAACGAAATLTFLALLAAVPATAATPAPSTSTTSPAVAGPHTGELLLIGFLLVLGIGGGLLTVRRYAHPDARANRR